MPVIGTLENRLHRNAILLGATPRAVREQRGKEGTLMLAMMLWMRRSVDVRMSFQEIGDPRRARPVVADHEDRLASPWDLIVMVRVVCRHAASLHHQTREQSWSTRPTHYPISHARPDALTWPHVNMAGLSTTGRFMQ